MEEEVWWCGGALLMTLSVIYLEFKAHLASMATTAYAIPFGLRLVGLSFIFQQDNNSKHPSRLCKDYLNRKESDGVLHQMTWPPLSPDLNPIEMVWMSRTAEWRKSSQQMLSICGNSFKSVGKAFQVVPSWLRECQERAKLSSRQRVATLVTTWFHICYFIMLMSSLLFYLVENSKNKETVE